VNRASIFLVLTLFATGASADEPATDRVRVEMLSQVEAVVPGSSVWIAFHFRMQQGWHIYWKDPGDSGMATSIEWQLPEGFEAGPLLWPTPQKLKLNTLNVVNAYEGETLLFSTVSVPDDITLGVPITLQAKASWLACKEICIAGERDLEITLATTAGESKPNPLWSAQIESVRRDLQDLSENQRRGE